MTLVRTTSRFAPCRSHTKDSPESAAFIPSPPPPPLFSSQAGLSYTSDVITLDLLADQDALGQVLARSPPMWEPGTAHGYHALTFGLYMSQLLRRADPKGRTLGQYFREEIAQPFGRRPLHPRGAPSPGRRLSPLTTGRGRVARNVESLAPLRS